MKKQGKGLGWYAGAAVLGLGMPVMMMGQAFAAAPTAKIYGTDAFDAKHSEGILFRNSKFDATTNPMTVILPDGGEPSSGIVGIEDLNLTCYDNIEKNDSYVEIKNGAIYNDEYLDVREYVWTGGSASLSRKWCYRTPGAGGSVAGMSGTPTAIFTYRGVPALGMEDVVMMDIANIELHFYNKSGDEVEFHGVIGMNDFEPGEQYSMLQGGGQVYLRESTALGYIEANDAWGIAVSGNNTDAQYDLWVQVDGTANNPLRLQYISEGTFTKIGHYRASAMMMEAVNLSYKIVGDKPDDATVPTSDIVTQYGSVAPASAKVVDGYTFDGWYYDQGLTKKVGTITNKLKEDTILYGKYVKVEEKEEDSPKTPDTGLYTGSDGFTKFGGVVAIAGSIAAGLTGYVVYKNRKHLLHKVKFSKKA